MLSRNRLVQSACLLALTAVAVAACNTPNANRNSGLANTEWQLSTLAGAPVASGTNATLGFGLAQASGFGGCNQFTTSYITDGGRGLMFGAIAATRMACGAATDAFETTYYASLGKVARYALAGGNLTLFDRANAVVLTYGPAAQATVEGPWNVTAVNNGQSAVSSVPAGVSGAMSFLANGSIEGFGGCNDFSGAYTVKGDTITVGPLMTTRKACGDPADTFEVQFLTALQNSTKWSVSGNQLDLRDDSGAQQVAATSAIGH
jgi:heat shock protein HslJ